MTTPQNNLPENLIYNILTYSLCDINDIFVIETLNKTFKNLIKEKKTEFLFYRNVFDFISKYDRFECYNGNYNCVPFEHWFNYTHTKQMISGFAVVNDIDIKNIKNVLNKFKLKKNGKRKKMKFYEVLPGTWPSVTTTLISNQVAIRFVIF